MKTMFQMENPDKVEMTMTITMTVKEWRVVAARLDKSNAWNFSLEINRMVSKAVQAFHPSAGEKTDD